eukprot:1116423-Amorphochlora_amoeboformis.AAC.1
MRSLPSCEYIVMRYMTLNDFTYIPNRHIPKVSTNIVLELIMLGLGKFRIWAGVGVVELGCRARGRGKVQVRPRTRVLGLEC